MVVHTLFSLVLMFLIAFPLVAIPVPLVLITLVRNVRKLLLGTIAYAESPGGPVRHGDPGAGLTPVELGALAGGVPRAVEVAFVSLLGSGFVQADPRAGRVRAVVHPRGGGPPEPLQVEMWHLLSGAGPQGYRVGELLARAAEGPAAGRLTEDLARKRVCVDPRPVGEASRSLRRYRIWNRVMGALAAWGVGFALIPYVVFSELIGVPLPTLYPALAAFVPVLLCAWQIRAVARLRVPFLTELGRGVVDQGSRRYREASGPVAVGAAAGAGSGRGDELLRRVAVNGMSM